MRLFVLTLSASFAFAQPPAPQPADPVVHPDHTVSFRYVAPSATSVAVALEGTRKPLPMQKDVAGIWTMTTDPLTPEIYSYHFDVDGQTALDPNNVSIKASYLATGNGFLVPGATPEPWERTAVPHGTIHHHAFTTKIVKGLDLDQDEFFVYTPPGYEARSARKYPVLYLLHGWSDTAGGWATIGRANDIFDNLIALGKVKPMIVVMPLGYGDMKFVKTGFGVWRDPPAIDHNVTLFSQSLLTEVLPQVEKLYNVSSKREDRAIAGLSMGGLEAIDVGLNHTAQFAYIGGFSAAVHSFKPETLTFNLKTADLRLLWIACGTSDDLIEPNRKLSASLKASGLPVAEIETPGMHTWMVWRDNLVHFAPLLFRGK